MNTIWILGDQLSPEHAALAQTKPGPARVLMIESRARGISPLLNLGLLTPRECVEAAVLAYEQGAAPINSVEGYVRQIIGWRYWTSSTNMPPLRRKCRHARVGAGLANRPAADHVMSVLKIGLMISRRRRECELA